MLLWTEHAITVAVARPSPHLPPFRSTPTSGLPSRMSGDNDNDVRLLDRAINTADGISDLDSLGTGNINGEPTSVPLGWVDPRLRGGRMLDVGHSDIELRRH
jgi:hypothetical protein